MNNRTNGARKPKWFPMCTWNTCEEFPAPNSRQTDDIDFCVMIIFSVMGCRSIENEVTFSPKRNKFLGTGGCAGVKTHLLSQAVPSKY